MAAENLRLLQVIAGAPQGGAEAFFVRLTAGLAEAGVVSHAVLRPHAERRAVLQAAGVGITELPFGGLGDRMIGTTRRGLLRAIDDFRPTVVLSWMNRATRFLPAAPARPRPYVHVARLGGYYELKYYKHCDWLVGNTKDIVDYLVDNGWPPARARYLPNFADETTSPAVSRASEGTPADVPLFLALGRLHVNKGFDVLLDAMARLPRAWLWLAGDGPLRADLEAQAAKLGIADRVRFLGWRDDGPALMAAADALVCPSRHEPLGNVVIEAWSRGLPVVAARAQGPAALLDDGETGLLVPTEDSAALAVALTRIAANRDLADKIGAAGQGAYEEQFSKTAVVARYVDFLREITAENPPKA
ncbi:MAG TPA: glycosyltransferase [Alphaproteobacteria bacterium]|jgi:glycosyltransferase involved in cell wall biosynthesis